jgi:E3 ubiquitin-protein ligase UBR4
MLLCVFLFSHRPLAILRPAKKKKVCKTRAKSTSVSFPIDFFEHSQVLNDIEFGGSDILHVYNAQQAKHRLMTAGMYIASTKVQGTE